MISQETGYLSLGNTGPNSSKSKLFTNVFKLNMQLSRNHSAFTELSAGWPISVIDSSEVSESVWNNHGIQPREM